MPVNVQSLAQSLSLPTETDPLLGGDFAPLSRQPNSYRAVDAVDTPSRQPTVSLAFPRCPNTPPPPPPRLSPAEREERVMERFFSGWGITGERMARARRALLDSVANLRMKETTSTDEALLSMSAANFLSADQLLRCFIAPDVRATVLQEIAPLWDIDLTWFARDATDVCDKMLPDDARRLSVVRCLARKTVSDRRELMVLLKNKRFATMKGSDGARCMELLVVLPVDTLRFLTKACDVHKQVITSADVRALAQVPSDQWEHCLQTLRRRAQREALTEEGVQRLVDLCGMGGYPHVVLHRALAFANDAHIHKPAQQSILDGTRGEEPTVRARASAAIRRLHGHAHKNKGTAREVEDAQFFAQCWCAAERHPTASYDVRFALTKALGQPSYSRKTFQQTMLMLLHPAFPELRLTDLANALR